jgi:hypothetical protein
MTQTNELTELTAHHYRIITDVKLILFNIYCKTDRYARVVDHLAVQNVAQGAPLGGGSTLRIHEPMDRNHLGQCKALSNKTECERYWEARTKKMEN